MKTKNLFAAMLFFIAIMASAQKRIEIADLPQPALNFIEKYFPGIPVDKIKKDVERGQKGYEVVLGDETEIEFRKDGSWREIEGHKKPIPTAYIDPKITTYVMANYPNNKITHIDYGHKGVDVDLTGKINLEFSKEGKILKGKK